MGTDAVGLVAVVRWFISKFSERGGIVVESDFPAKLCRLHPDVEIALFRVVQEALSNAQRHSGSPVVRIRIAEQRKHVRVEIEDDEKEFPPTSLRIAMK